MDIKDTKYIAYCDILREELVSAMGCTEPIALAYAGAIAKDTLGKMPEEVIVEASGSIIKNVKSVVVPNTNGLKGIEPAVAAGIVAGKKEKELEVISEVSAEDIEAIAEFLKNVPIRVDHIETGITFEIIVTVKADSDEAKVRIANYHTNIVLIELNGEIIKKIDVEGEEESGLTDRTLLNVRDILEFADTARIEDLKELIEKQVEYNMAIAEEGLKENYGANIGKVLLSSSDEVDTLAKAMAAAGSDARMNGCEMPVVINSGSGNQGITVSVPVIVYAKKMGVSEEKMYRALAVSNLTAIHQKTGIGRLSAYCGAVSAGAGAGAGIAYLNGGGYEEIAHTLVNALAIVSGMICDGAKASCAAKIATSVEAGILGYNMFVKGQNFEAGDGIVEDGIENTLVNVGRLGKDGMKQTNDEIISMMIGK